MDNVDYIGNCDNCGKQDLPIAIPIVKRERGEKVQNFGVLIV
jgi:hypothetical protein